MCVIFNHNISNLRHSWILRFPLYLFEAETGSPWILPSDPFRGNPFRGNSFREDPDWAKYWSRIEQFNSSAIHTALFLRF